MSEAVRITPEEARRKVLAGEALLVCGYDSDEKFGLMRLEGAIPLSEFERQLPQLARTQEVVFYCG
jgi:hypothetical protein